MVPKIKTISPPRSFIGWNIYDFIKGRKKTVVTIVGGWIGYLINDSITAVAIGASVVEICFALAEYWLKRKHKI